MTVKELIKLLEKFEPDAMVILSKDGEGNCFSPLADDFSLGEYVPTSTWSGEFTSDEYLEDAPDEENGHRAVCLWPIN